MKSRIVQSYRSLQLIAAALFFLPGLVSADGNLSFEVKSLITPKSFEDLLIAILKIFITLATPIVVFFIIYAGFLYVTARGNAQQVEQATRALTYAIIGGVIVLGAVTITTIVSGVVGSFQVK